MKDSNSSKCLRKGVRLINEAMNYWFYAKWQCIAKTNLQRFGYGVINIKRKHSTLHGKENVQGEKIKDWTVPYICLWEQVMMNARFDVHSSQMYLICRVVSNRHAEGFINKVGKNQLKKKSIDLPCNLAIY